MAENIKALALRLLDRFDEHISAQLLLLRYNQGKRSGPHFSKLRGPIGFTGLHGVAFLGIVEIVAVLLDVKELDVNAVDCMGSTALTWATIRGHEGVVKMLLEREDVNPNQADTEYGRTPLWWAAEEGHKEVVKLLLEREGVNPDQIDTKYGSTPLSLATWGRHEEVVKILLEREDINPNQADTKYSRTPLSWAAEKGYGRVVKVLLERNDVSTGTLDNKGQIPLSLALSHGRHGVVRTIREWGNANSGTADPGRQIPPLSSTGNGDEFLVELPFFRDGCGFSVDTSDSDGRPAPPSADYNEKEMVLNPQDSVSLPIDSNFSTEPSRQSQPPPVGPLQPPHPPKTTSTHPSPSQSIISFAVNQRFIISSLICLFAFLLYILPSSSLDILLFRKYLSSKD